MRTYAPSRSTSHSLKALRTWDSNHLELVTFSPNRGGMPGIPGMSISLPKTLKDTMVMSLCAGAMYGLEVGVRAFVR